MTTDPVSLEMSAEYSFDPQSLSDFTVHFRSTSFHLHALHMYERSKYFQAILDSETEPCTITDKCQRPGHRCVTIGDHSVDNGDTTTTKQTNIHIGCLGGVAVKVDDLYEFFKRLYMHADGTGQWKQRVSEDTDNDELPDNYIARISATDVANDSVTYQLYTYDQMYERTVKGSYIAGRKASLQSVNSWSYGLSILDSPQYHLVNYFQCDWLMKKLDDHAALVVELASDNDCFYACWRILRLADRYHWKSVREACINACIRHRDCGTLPSWKIIYQTLDPQTVIDLFTASVNRVPIN
jgi:hypothetical protein